MFDKKSILARIVNVDKDKCVNCHQCISVCPSKFCNNASEDFVEVNPDLCIGCGACIEACSHEARYGIDDFDSFLDSKDKKQIVAIVAPAIAANFPDKYLHFNGWLKSVGVKAIFDVSFGAELTVKSYLYEIKSKNLKHTIAQPCPAMVGYVEVHYPELIQFLAPADSPMMHTIKMVREFYKEYKNAEFVIISPCYAKRREFDEVGIGGYNVTYKSLDNYFRKNNIDLGRYEPLSYDNPPAERAVLFSTPGGLLRTAQRELPGIENMTRKIEGHHTIYNYLGHFMESVNKGTAPLLVDCLNCEMGCNGGPGTLNVGKNVDEIENLVEKRSLAAQKNYLKTNGFFSKVTGKHTLKNLITKYWKKDLYIRKYADRSFLKKKWIKEPDQKQIDEINKKMYKIEKQDFTFGYSLNEGCKKSRGKYLVFASAHVLPVDEYWLSNLLAPFNNEKVAVVYGRQIGDDGAKFSEKMDLRRLFGNSPINSNIVLNYYANNANSVVRKSIWEENKFDEYLFGFFATVIIKGN